VGWWVGKGGGGGARAKGEVVGGHEGVGGRER